MYLKILQDIWNDNRNTKLEMTRLKEAVSQSDKRARLVEAFSHKVALNERKRLNEFVRDGCEKEEKFAELWAEQEKMRKTEHDKKRREVSMKMKEHNAKRYI